MSDHPLSERNRANRLAGYARMSPEERAEQSRPGREALLARFEREADPEGRMTAGDRREAAERLRKAHLGELARKSAAVRRRKKRLRETAAAAAKAAVEAALAADGTDARAIGMRAAEAALDELAKEPDS